MNGDIHIENERLCKEIHQVTTLTENFKLEVEKLTHQNQLTGGMSIHNG